MPPIYAKIDSVKADEKEPVWDYATGVSHLVRHRSSGRYYTRVQVAGKRRMIALKTSVVTVARLRHADTLAKTERQRQSQRRAETGVGTMGDLLDRIVADSDSNTARALKSKIATQTTVLRLVKHWTVCFGSDLRAMAPHRITVDQVRRFANYLHGEAQHQQNQAKKSKRGYKPVTVNKTLELIHRALRVGVELGILPALPFDLDPVVGGPIRKPRESKKLRLPSGSKMQEVFEQMRAVPLLKENQELLRPYLIERGMESAELAEFMAYSGARISEAIAFDWKDDFGDLIILHGTKTETSEDREVPKIAALRELLKRMRTRRVASDREIKGKAFQITQCREGLASACRRAGVERLTHHSLRHFFATICIEAGVDIPTISRWLGHADGGVLAMKTYGHLRNEHSIAAAAKVSAMVPGKLTKKSRRA